MILFAGIMQFRCIVPHKSAKHDDLECCAFSKSAVFCLAGVKLKSGLDIVGVDSQPNWWTTKPLLPTVVENAAGGAS